MFWRGVTFVNEIIPFPHGKFSIYNQSDSGEQDEFGALV